MDILTKDECHVNLEDLQMNIEDGKIFIHPTDTIYGIGCDATNNNSVKKVRDIKARQDTPFSVIAPSKDWIIKNCHINDKSKQWVDKLPGPYTLILKLKNKNCISPSVNMDLDSLGVRIPDHWFSEIVKKIGTPIVTTSANKHGENFMTSLDDLSPSIQPMIDFIIYEEEKHGKPSTIVDLTKDEPVIIKR